jgi:phosphopantothenate-cysteine ligase
MEEHPYEAVIHAMAVSDYTPVYTDALAQFETQLAEENSVADVINQHPLDHSAKKLSSNADYLVTVLKRTPKVIERIKTLQPATKLVGFKLLVDVSREELLATAHASMEKSQADFVLANDLTEITGEAHHGYLLNAQSDNILEAQTKAEIATLIVSEVSK